MNSPIEVTDETISVYETLADKMQDQRLKDALDQALVFMAKPKSYPEREKVAVLITQLSAHALDLRMKYVTYMTWSKNNNEASHKKNTYRSAYEGIDRLVDSMKYMVKQ